MALRTKRSASHQFLRLTDNLDGLEYKSVPTVSRSAPVVYKPRAKAYRPMSLLQLLEWQFLCWRPSLNDHNNLLTRNGVTSRSLDFTAV